MKPRCSTCFDTGHVCENHPDRPWDGLIGDVVALVCTNTKQTGPPLTPEMLDEYAVRAQARERQCRCGGAGMPCPACCSPIPEDGTRSIVEAFTPDWQRADPIPPDPDLDNVVDWP